MLRSFPKCGVVEKHHCMKRKDDPVDFNVREARFARWLALAVGFSSAYIKLERKGLSTIGAVT